MSDKKNDNTEKTTDDYRQEIASIIRGLRESKKYTYETLAKKTRISTPNLISLEEGSVDFYRDKVFVYGYIRIICKELKSPTEELLALCGKCFGGQQTYRIQAKSLFLKEKKHTFYPLKSFFKNLESVLALALFFVISSFIYTSYQNNEKPTNSLVITQEERTEEKDKKSLVKVDSKLSEDIAQKEKVTKVQESKKEEPQKKNLLVKTNNHERVQATLEQQSPCLISKKDSSCISLKVKETTEISTSIDNKPKITKTYNQGTYNFSYQKTLEFFFADANLVELIKDKKNWGVISKRHERKRLKLSTASMPINPNEETL